MTLDDVMDLGSYTQYDGRPAVRFGRRLTSPAGRVWEAVSSERELAKWFPSRVEIEPRAGGVVRFAGDPHVDGMSGRVLVFDPPHRWAFTWGGDELRVDVLPVDESSCELTLIDVLESSEAAARNAAGWSVCLAELATLLSRGRTDGPHAGNGARWRSYYEAYLAAGLPSGAPVPEAIVTPTYLS